ncbi:MAG: FAD-binding protein [Dehalococcoidia bacterium]|nr:FAD-binding protein [Dehalococcoidia bacterium]
MADEVVMRDIDVLVIGGGLAGTFAAIKAREAGASHVVQVDKASVGRSGCSAFGAGVIRTFFPHEDDRDKAVYESVLRSHFLCDQERLAQHLDDVYDRIREMDSFGVEFEKTPDGKFDRILARGIYRRVMFRGGYRMMEAMRKAAIEKGVKIVDRVMVTDLLTDGGGAAGAIGFSTESGQVYEFYARSVVLATGRGFMKGRRPGHRNVTGDGMAAAYRAGVTLAGLDSAVPNTGPAHYDIGPGNNMYLGAGGLLVNSDGRRFAETFDPALKERTELGILSVACAIEARRGRTPLYLDMTGVEPEKVQRMKRVIPLPLMMYERAGVVVGDRFVKRIEWVIEGPSCNGGLLVNSRYETTLPGLFTCGDTMPAVGPEGQTALPGAMTSGARAGKYAAGYASEVPPPKISREQVAEFRERMFAPLKRRDGIEPDQVLLSVQEALMPYDVLVLRHEERLKAALQEVEGIWHGQVPLLQAYDPHYLRMAHEAGNIALVARMMLESALYRRESRESLREDYPYLDHTEWVKLVTVKRDGDRMELGAAPVPLERYKLRPPVEKVLHPLWRAAEKQGIIRVENGSVKWA